MKHLIVDLKLLRDEGFKIKRNGVEYTIFINPVCYTADIPAVCSLLETSGASANHPCYLCNIRREKRSDCQIHDNEEVEESSKVEIVEDESGFQQLRIDSSDYVKEIFCDDNNNTNNPNNNSNMNMNPININNNINVNMNINPMNINNNINNVNNMNKINNNINNVNSASTSTKKKKKSKNKNKRVKTNKPVAFETKNQTRIIII